jgi:hypothetical protein
VDRLRSLVKNQKVSGRANKERKFEQYRLPCQSKIQPGDYGTRAKW